MVQTDGGEKSGIPEEMRKRIPVMRFPSVDAYDEPDTLYL